MEIANKVVDQLIKDIEGLRERMLARVQKHRKAADTPEAHEAFEEYNICNGMLHSLTMPRLKQHLTDYASGKEDFTWTEQEIARRGNPVRDK